MTGERQQPSALVPLRELYPADAFGEKGKEAFHPLGGIVYAGCSRIVLLKQSSEDGALVSEHRNAPEKFNPQAVVESKRIINLGAYDEIHVGAITFGEGVTIATNPSLDTRPTIEVNFDYVDAGSGERERFTLEEETLLDVLSMGEGAFAQLKGSGREEVALVIPRTIAARSEEEKPQKVAHVLFLRGNTDTEGLDSVVGLQVFLEQLNTRLEATATAYQRLAISSFEDHLRRGELVFDSPVRKTMVRSAISAMARKYELTGEVGYKKQLEQALPNLRRDALGLVVHTLHRVLRVKHPANRQVLEDMAQRMILSRPGEQQRKALPDVKQELGENTIVQRLKTPELIAIREEYGSPKRLNGDQQAMYVQAASALAFSPNVNREQIGDIELLLAEAARHIWAGGLYRYAITNQGVRLYSNDIDQPDAPRQRRGNEFISDVQNAVAARRIRLELDASNKLKTERAKKARSAIGSNFGEFTEIMHSYGSNVVRMCNSATTILEIDDVITMAREMQLITDSRRLRVVTNMQGQSVAIPALTRSGKTYAELSEEIIAVAMRKRDKMIAEAEKPIYDRLKTDIARSMRRGYEPLFDQDVEATKGYIENMVVNASERTNREAIFGRLDDFETLLYELQGARGFVNSEVSFIAYYRSDTIPQLIYLPQSDPNYGKYLRKGSELITDTLRVLNSIRKRAAS